MRFSRRECPSKVSLFALCFAVGVGSHISFAWSATAKLSAKFQIISSLKAENISSPGFSLLSVQNANDVNEEVECYLDPQTGNMVGNACLEDSGDAGLMVLEGSQYQSVSIRVKGSESQLLRYAPQFFDSPDQQLDIVVPSASHQLKIGGTMYLDRNAKQDDIDAPQYIAYAVEITYP